ncbi:FecCD family ABC transporter permease [Paenibacillus crassostreae]|uniref:FecCD family ABC transporter permease n=1 Tax=Paenibacillus crassostreae TaxID=1763538 RepID=UPI0009EF6578|nr:iron ABC transporter permease [Paenibacillus crassostreae]
MLSVQAQWVEQQTESTSFKLKTRPWMATLILVGGLMLLVFGMAVSGAMMQGMTRNPLADSGLLGLNAGAGLMVILFISFYSSTSAVPVLLLPLLALIGASLTAIIIFSLSYKKNDGLHPNRLLLTGIGVAAAISAATIVLTLSLSPENYKFVANWMAGSIWGANWEFVLALLPWMLTLLPYAFFKAPVLNILNLGDQTATGLGASVEKERVKLLAVAIGLAGSCVSVSGGIGFVGLIGPHMARRLVGPKHQMLIPISAMLGSLLVIVGDIIGRWLLQPSEIPTGIVVAVIGAPYFLYLLGRTK